MCAISLSKVRYCEGPTVGKLLLRRAPLAFLALIAGPIAYGTSAYWSASSFQPVMTI